MKNPNFLELEMDEQETLFTALKKFHNPDLYSNDEVDRATDFLIYAFRDMLSIEYSIAMGEKGKSEEEIEKELSNGDCEMRMVEYLVQWLNM